MSKMLCLVIEDSFLMKYFQKKLPNDCSLFCQTYDDAQSTINHLELASDEYLCVILDHNLGDPGGRSGVDLFFQIRKKFPEAYIINFSSNTEHFLEEVKLRYANQLHDFDAYEIKVTFDDTTVDKSPQNAIACARRYQEVRRASADKDCWCSFSCCFRDRRAIGLDYKDSHSAYTDSLTIQR